MLVNSPKPTRFCAAFSQQHVILPVIHVKDEDQALRNAWLAREAGADGVFLINHGISSDRLFSVLRVVKTEHSDWWVGVNCLGMMPSDIFHYVDNSVSGVWVDNGMIDEESVEQPHAQFVSKVRTEKHWLGLYFGGVAFKYQRPVKDLVKAATTAQPYMDVVTTSGPGTGMEASVDKIRTMKQALGSFPLAIASGITPENVSDYLEYADCFLVATGVSWSFHEFDLMKLIELVGIVCSCAY